MNYFIYNNTRKIATILLTAIMLVATSCEDVLQTDPRQSIDFDGALSTRDGVVAAMNSVYARLRAVRYYGRDMFAVPDALSDIGRATNNSGRLIGEANNNVGAHFFNGANGPWQTAYAGINEINLILEAIPVLTDPLATDANKAQWVGEMKFLRALFHFDLARIYGYDPGAIVAARYKGAVPISITAFRTVESSLNYKPSRADVEEVYAQIYADLTDAIANLPLSANPSKYYANLGAARALFSRVALYNKDFAKSISEATEALAIVAGGTVAYGASLQTGTAYVNGWRATQNPESMFEVRFLNADENIGVNEALQTTFTTISGAALGTSVQKTTVGGWGDLVPTAGLLSDLQLSTTGTTVGNMVIVRGGTDVRGFLYDIGNGRGSGPKIENIKFLGKSGTINLDNVPLIRVSEVYLNRAEAYYESGNEPLALADLNSIRVARGLTSVSLSGTALLNEILRQRKIEFAFEGQRFFDLKRRGQNIVKLPADVPFDDFRILPAIPQRELDGNPNMVQNDGY
jgi:starch-binding outer membrane protein, SusD/RagB family